jgi:hypothetical protein
MTTDLATPLNGPVDLDAARLAQAIEDHTPAPPAYDAATVRLWATWVVRLAREAGMRPSLLAAQMLHETGWLRFGGLVRPGQYNFAGLGATGPGQPGASYPNLATGIRAVIAHRAAYQYGSPLRWPAALVPYADLDPRVAAVIAAGHGGTVQKVGDFTNGRWAYTAGIPVGSLANGYAAGIVRAANELLAAAGTEGHMAPRIAVSAGHHNTDGGSAVEVRQTGQLAHELLAACRALGMEAISLTPQEGLGMDTVGLQAVARRVTTLDPLPDIFLECHTEGGGGTGVFAIYPDWPAASDTDADVRDDLGPRIAGAVVAATGLGLGAGGDGVMSERQTGVGATGSRLGVFAATAPVKGSVTRLIVEYGAHDKQPDLAIASAPGFAADCAAATAGAIAAWLDWTPPTDNTGQGGTMPTYTLGSPFVGFYHAAVHGLLLGPMVAYTDGGLRQLCENAVLESVPGQQVRAGGLGQAYLHGTGKRIADWPTVHPLLP